jgi:hypothetical protein
MRKEQPAGSGDRAVNAALRGMVLALAAASCGGVEGSVAGETRYGPYEPAVEAQEFHVPPPPFSEGVFPCSECHDPELPVNTNRRKLTLAHEDVVLHHAEEARWCLDCHSASDRDHLHLANGELVPFEESYRLCGQCHGDKYRDWRAGVHGRRTGNWDGEKSYLLCVNCHNSHDPHFAPLAPLPPPVRPRRTP